MSIHVTTEIKEDTVIITITGSFIYSDHEKFSAVCEQLPRKHSHYSVDLRELQTLDSTALQMLLHLKDELGIDGKMIKILASDNIIANMLKITRFYDIFQVEIA